MTYRPYPSVDRALRQLDRHVLPVPTREPTEFELHLAQWAKGASEALGEAMRPYMAAMARWQAPGVVAGPRYR